jgi:ubiquinol-cytochrome c reductase cytochrome c1 subunit
MIKKIFATLIIACGLVAGASAATGGMALTKAPDLSGDRAALQNGAKLFVNYCLNCHSAAFMRFNRLKDIGLTEQQIKDNLLFTTEKVGDTMKAAIDPKQAKEFFGVNPPDLTLIARSRSGPGGSGADYLYSYLRGFYIDPSRETGWNNLYFPNVGMPHVMWEAQGLYEPVVQTTMQHGKEEHLITGLKQVTAGTQSPEQFDKDIGDLVAFLHWMGEPAREARVNLGIAVMLFLALLSFLTYRLNKAYWKDIK